jgi:molybdopterin converting factor small subunit
MLVEKYGEDFKNRVYDKNNVLKESTGIILNNSIVSSLDTTISDGDKIVFTIAPISGG